MVEHFHKWEDVEKPLKQVCSLMLRRNEDVWDLINSVWAMPKFHSTPMEHIKNGIFQCVRQWRRKENHFGKAERYMANNPLSLETPEGNRDRDIEIESTDDPGFENKEFVEKCLKSLKGWDQTIVYSIYVLGWSQREFARKYGYSNGNVSMMHSRAIKKLKRLHKRY